MSTSGRSGNDEEGKRRLNRPILPVDEDDPATKTQRLLNRVQEVDDRLHAAMQQEAQRKVALKDTHGQIRQTLKGMEQELNNVNSEYETRLASYDRLLGGRPEVVRSLKTLLRENSAVDGESLDSVLDRLYAWIHARCRIAASDNVVLTAREKDTEREFDEFVEGDQALHNVLDRAKLPEYVKEELIRKMRFATKTAMVGENKSVDALLKGIREIQEMLESERTDKRAALVSQSKLEKSLRTTKSKLRKKDKEFRKMQIDVDKRVEKMSRSLRVKVSVLQEERKKLMTQADEFTQNLAVKDQAIVLLQTQLSDVQRQQRLQEKQAQRYEDQLAALREQLAEQSIQQASAAAAIDNGSAGGGGGRCTGCDLFVNYTDGSVFASDEPQSHEEAKVTGSDDSGEPANSYVPGDKQQFDQYRSTVCETQRAFALSRRIVTAHPPNRLAQLPEDLSKPLHGIIEDEKMASNLRQLAEAMLSKDSTAGTTAGCPAGHSLTGVWASLAGARSRSSQAWYRECRRSIVSTIVQLYLRMDPERCGYVSESRWMSFFSCAASLVRSSGLLQDHSKSREAVQRCFQYAQRHCPCWMHAKGCVVTHNDTLTHPKELVYCCCSYREELKAHPLYATLEEPQAILPSTVKAQTNFQLPSDAIAGSPRAAFATSSTAEIVAFPQFFAFALRQWNHSSNFRQACMNFAWDTDATTVSTQRILRNLSIKTPSEESVLCTMLYKTFQSVDVDGDGFWSPYDLYTWTRALNVPDAANKAVKLYQRLALITGLIVESYSKLDGEQTVSGKEAPIPPHNPLVSFASLLADHELPDQCDGSFPSRLTALPTPLVRLAYLLELVRRGYGKDQFVDPPEGVEGREDKIMSVTVTDKTTVGDGSTPASLFSIARKHVTELPGIPFVAVYLLMTREALFEILESADSSVADSQEAPSDDQSTAGSAPSVPRGHLCTHHQPEKKSDLDVDTIVASAAAKASVPQPYPLPFEQTLQLERHWDQMDGCLFDPLWDPAMFKELLTSEVETDLEAQAPSSSKYLRDHDLCAIFPSPFLNFVTQANRTKRSKKRRKRTQHAPSDALEKLAAFFTGKLGSHLTHCVSAQRGMYTPSSSRLLLHLLRIRLRKRIIRKTSSKARKLSSYGDSPAFLRHFQSSTRPCSVEQMNKGTSLCTVSNSSMDDAEGKDVHKDQRLQWCDWLPTMLGKHVCFVTRIVVTPTTSEAMKGSEAALYHPSYIPAHPETHHLTVLYGGDSCFGTHVRCWSVACTRNPSHDKRSRISADTDSHDRLRIFYALAHPSSEQIRPPTALSTAGQVRGANGANAQSVVPVTRQSSEESWSGGDSTAVRWPEAASDSEPDQPPDVLGILSPTTAGNVSTAPYDGTQEGVVETSVDASHGSSRQQLATPTGVAASESSTAPVKTAYSTGPSPRHPLPALTVTTPRQSDAETADADTLTLPAVFNADTQASPRGLVPDVLPGSALTPRADQTPTAASSQSPPRESLETPRASSDVQTASPRGGDGLVGALSRFATDTDKDDQQSPIASDAADGSSGSVDQDAPVHSRTRSLVMDINMPSTRSHLQTRVGSPHWVSPRARTPTSGVRSAAEDGRIPPAETTVESQPAAEEGNTGGEQQSTGHFTPTTPASTHDTPSEPHLPEATLPAPSEKPDHDSVDVSSILIGGQIPSSEQSAPVDSLEAPANMSRDSQGNAPQDQLAGEAESPTGGAEDGPWEDQEDATLGGVLMIENSEQTPPVRSEPDEHPSGTDPDDQHPTRTARPQTATAQAKVAGKLKQSVRRLQEEVAYKTTQMRTYFQLYEAERRKNDMLMKALKGGGQVVVQMESPMGPVMSAADGHGMMSPGPPSPAGTDTPGSPHIQVLPPPKPEPSVHLHPRRRGVLVVGESIPMTPPRAADLSRVGVSDLRGTYARLAASSRDGEEIKTPAPTRTPRTSTFRTTPSRWTSPRRTPPRGAGGRPRSAFRSPVSPGPHGYYTTIRGPATRQATVPFQKRTRKEVARQLLNTPLIKMTHPELQRRYDELVNVMNLPGMHSSSGQ